MLMVVLVLLCQSFLFSRIPSFPFAMITTVATLGIVEFVVFLIQKYYAGLDKAQKDVFADVHFMLFYCALFNALQTVLLAVTSYSVANHLWVRTEALELDHYIEIREEFERVDSILYGNVEERQRPTSEFVFEYNVRGIRKLWQRIYRFVRYPILSQRHAELLVQVRFHDLRVHFLKANDLPLQLRVSDYLTRSLLSVLQKLAHISAMAWLLLTGGICMLYFFMGIVVYVTEDLKMVGVSMTWIFLCSMIFSVLLSLIIFNKMKWIFQRIMRMKLMASRGDDFKSGMSIRKGEKEVQNQSDLFWGSNPDYITVIIQFAQFGFALALAVLLVFWDDINVKGVPVASWVYIFTVFVCYAAFVAITAQVIPRYTLCTNLGQLVNKAHLQETLGQFYLEEAERKRQLRLEDQDDDEYYEMETFDEASALSKDSPSTSGHVGASVRSTTTNTSKEKEKPTLLAELVQMDTESLRLAFPSGPQSTRSHQERTMRRKAVSDGVALMRSMTGKPPKVPAAPIPRSRLERKKSNSASDAILQMKQAEDDKPPSASASSIPRSRLGRKKSLSASDAILQMKQAEDDKPPNATASSIPRSRLGRKKSHSASDAILQMKQAGDVEPIPRSNGPSLKQPAGSRFEVIDEHKESLAPNRNSNHRPFKTPSSSSAPLPPLDDSTGEVIDEVDNSGVDKKDPLVGSLATLSHPQELNSDADDHSDVDDIPQIGSPDEEDHSDDHAESETLHDVVTDYFLGPKYPVVSAVFGTLGCFWVVGQRVEELLLATETMPDLKNTFQFPLKVSFWWEATYLCCFILTSSFVTLAFGPGRATCNKERALSLAGFLDFTLASICLALLMIAEAQRCFCEEGDDVADCCPQFGSRSYGGVGSIEPFTSLIVLRLFRFWVAKRVIGFLDKYTKWSAKDAAPTKDHHHGHQDHGHGHGHGDPRELAIDVWKGALSLYPDVVEEHGEFSTELLQAMLGVDTGGSKSIKHEVVAKPHGDETVTMDATSSVDAVSSKAGGYVPKRLRHRHLSLEEAKHSSNIVLGKTTNPTAAKKEAVSGIPVHDPQASGDSSNEKFTFIRPNAKLLRSMRRCDRKLLPLINTWTAVDVVITKYEIVYFEAIDVADLNKAKYSDDDVIAMEAGRKGLEATMGGKGLRLNDVAKGRKVIGHLAISAIDNVHVDRILPHEDTHQHDDTGSSERHDEFWEPNEKTYGQGNGLGREARWATLKEDRLMIHSNHGTLCFRFYSDLHDMEAHRERCLGEQEGRGALHKDLALLWCQTIARICKRAQLKQKLDHYGDGNDEELRDYLRVVDHKNDGNKGVMGRIHRRASSAIDLFSKPRLRRGNSLPTDESDGGGGGGLSPAIAHPRLRRASSLPTTETGATTPTASAGEPAAKMPRNVSFGDVAMATIHSGDDMPESQVAEHIA